MTNLTHFIFTQRTHPLLGHTTESLLCGWATAGDAINFAIEYKKKHSVTVVVKDANNNEVAKYEPKKKISV